MPHINLLPWRDELRKRREKEFIITAVIAALMMGGVVLGVHLHYESRIAYQDQRNTFIETEISALDKKIKEIENLKKERDSLIARTKVIQDLQAGRPEIVHVFDELVTTLPDGVYYTKVAQKGRGLNLQGVAQSNARVSSLMRSLNTSTWFENSVLVEIKTNPEKETAVRLSKFILNVGQAKQKKPDEKQEGTGG
ncbi:MAG: PilN domain-containing protein [Gammaproteobacteria bacterium]|jgi:type IV pilus assembly protein PilN|nr:PilN domain-containing protein [Gammaproteobacteria bacterium]